MYDSTVRRRLRTASESVRRARGRPGADDVEDRLSGIAEQLSHPVDRPSADPEAHVYPTTAALDTIDRRLTEVIERTDDEALEDHLESACDEIRAVIGTLDDR